LPPDTAANASNDQHPYARLTPDQVLDALAGVGLYGDGRLMALSSYENRVYQATLEDGERVVAKFYRPGRWSTAHILEEHAFATELAAAEVPVVAPLLLHGATLHQHAGFAFSVSPWRGGRLPELDDFEVLEWLGRFIARLHCVGAERNFQVRPALDLQQFGQEPRDWLLAQDVIPLELRTAWQQACDQALELIAARAFQQRAGGEKDPQNSPIQHLRADAVVVACGSYSAPLLRSVGLRVPIYPGKGYSATFALRRPEAAPWVSTIDDAKKIAMSRLGDSLRVAGTIELSGWDLTLDSPLAQARCHMLARRIETLLPGVCDTRLPHEGGQPQFWAGLRPATPTNIPLIGATPLAGLWLNAGHGTLGWTHGAGSGRALAALMSGERPALSFRFLGESGVPPELV